MPIFGESSSPYDEFVEKVTAETLTSENWELMIDICDKTNADPKGPKLCLLSVKKRLNHRDPHVVLLALSLLDCLWSNCGQKFRREVSSKEFINELNYKCTNSNRVVAEKARSLIKKWVEVECKEDSSLSLVLSLYKELIDQGYSFEADLASANKKKEMLSTDPNVVTSDQEEADIARAIALSLQENGVKKQQSKVSNPNATAYPSLRSVEPSQNSPSIQAANPLSPPQQPPQQARQVRALYDFEAGEDNEISFVAGELIALMDDSDQNWWRGSNARGAIGLFPSTFVTTDLNEPTLEQTPQQGNGKQGIEVVEAEAGVVPSAKVQIDENVLLRCIELVEGLDPTLDASSDPPELAFLENMAMAQAPLIDHKLMQIDKQLSQLAEVDLAIRDVLGAYDNAVQQVAASSALPIGAHPSPQQQLQGSSHAPSPVLPQMVQIPNAASQPQVGAGRWQQQQ